MFGIGVQEKKKSQVMIADRRFHPKDIQDIIKTAVNTGNMLVNQDEYAKYLFEYNGFKIIGENFKTKKNSNKENEAFINFRNLELMNKRTIESYKPIMAFVNNKSNSSDGWLFYHNRYSEPCKQIHYVQIIDLLNDLHLKKMVFLNPGIKNFLYDGTRVFVSDVKIKKNNLGKIGEFLNFISLKNTAFIFEKIYTFKDNLLYKLLVHYCLKHTFFLQHQIKVVKNNIE